MPPHILDIEIPVPTEVYLLYDLLSTGNKSTEMYMVGGCVRDFLYHRFHGDTDKEFVAKDIDLTTNLSEEEILKRLNSPYAQKAGVRVKEKESVDTFGVVFVSVKGSPTYEIAPFRKDIGVGDGRRPERVERATIEEDAMRRDLTMNNLYYDFLRRRILDFNPDGQGIKDIQNKIARFVGDPFERINEDKLRIMRFVRFFSRINSDKITGYITERTHAAIHEYKDLHKYKGISPERVQMEFMAGLKQSLNTTNYLLSLLELDLFPAVFPGLQVNVINMANLGNLKNPRVVLARILNGNDGVGKKLNELKYPNEISIPVQFLIDVQTFDPKDAIKVLKDRDKRLVKAKNRILTPEEARVNAAIYAEMQQDLSDLCTVLQDSNRLNIVRHLKDYTPVIPDGDRLATEGMKGKEIGEYQRRIMQQSYEASLSWFLESGGSDS
jgi:tRNA nucleotidyltransferase/poly(A) polymerase